MVAQAAQFVHAERAPVVNVVAAALIVASVVPIYLAQRLSSDVGAH